MNGSVEEIVVKKAWIEAGAESPGKVELTLPAMRSTMNTQQKMEFEKRRKN
jgi:hypothetical protein